MCGEGVRVDIVDRSTGPEKMKPTCAKQIKKLQQLLAAQAQSIGGACLGQIFPRRRCVAAGHRGTAASPGPPDLDHVWACQVADHSAGSNDAYRTHAYCVSDQSDRRKQRQVNDHNACGRPTPEPLDPSGSGTVQGESNGRPRSHQQTYCSPRIARSWPPGLETRAGCAKKPQ